MSPETEKILDETADDLTCGHLDIDTIKEYLMKIYDIGFEDGREYVVEYSKVRKT